MSVARADLWYAYLRGNLVCARRGSPAVAGGVPSTVEPRRGQPPAPRVDGDVTWSSGKAHTSDDAALAEARAECDRRARDIARVTMTFPAETVEPDGQVQPTRVRRGR